MSYTVAIYLCDRAYGGPEEGGWYYDCGVPAEEYAQHTKGYHREGDANRYARRLNETLIPTLNEGRREITSILSEGRYGAIVQQGNPSPYPTQQPSYE